MFGRVRASKYDRLSASKLLPMLSHYKEDTGMFGRKKSARMAAIERVVKNLR